MNTNTDKIKSFTLTEIIIVLLISCILINSIYLVFQFSTKMISKLSTITDNNSTLLKIDYLLTKDLLETEKINTSTNFIKLYHNNREIEYNFNDDNIIRKALIIDTFNISSKLIKLDSIYNEEKGNPFIEIEFLINNNTTKKKYKTHL